MEYILEDLSPRTLLKANRANIVAFVHLIRDMIPDTKILEDEELLCYHSPIPHPLFNGILFARLDAVRAEQRIRDVVQIFRDRDRTAIWTVWPDDQPGDLNRRLQVQGLMPIGGSPLMGMDLAGLVGEPALPGLEIRRIGNEQEMESFLEVLARVFSLAPAALEGFWKVMMGEGVGPDTRSDHYLGLLDGHPVATGTLFGAAGVAGIYNVATLPDFRGRGIGRAITLRALQVARGKGYRGAVLQSSPDGVPVYRRLGLTEHGYITRYMLKVQ